MVGYLRARKDEQKEERRRLLLDAARRLFEKAEFGDLTMAAVAAEAKLAKGTVYLYFATKEELFLSLLEEELWAWFDEVDAHLDRLRGGTLEKVTHVIVETLSRRTLLGRLFVILHALLERNIAEASAFRFKAAAIERIARTGARLEALLPLGAGDGAQAILTLYALVVGLLQMSTPSPTVAKVLEDPRLAPMRIDFSASLGRAVRALLAGMVSEHNEQRSKS